MACDATEWAQPSPQLASKPVHAFAPRATALHPIGHADAPRKPGEGAEPTTSADDLPHILTDPAAEEPLVVRSLSASAADRPMWNRVGICLDRGDQADALEASRRAAGRMPVAPRLTPQTTALLVQRHGEFPDRDASSQPTLRLEPPVIEHAMSPPQRRVLVSAEHRAATTDGEASFHAPEEGAPALHVLQVAERRPGEGAEGAAATATAETLSPGEAPPSLDAAAVAVGANGSVAETAAMFRAERKAEVCDGCDEGRLGGHDPTIRLASGRKNGSPGRQQFPQTEPEGAAGERSGRPEVGPGRLSTRPVGATEIERHACRKMGPANGPRAHRARGSDWPVPSMSPERLHS